MSEASPVRTIEIASPSGGGESIGVLRAVFHIALWSALLVSAQINPATHGGTTPSESAEAPFVKRFQNLDGADQRVFRSFQEGLGEVERRRVREGAWPKVEALAADGIPPFADDPIDQEHYVWSLLVKRGIANYVGTPAKGSSRASFFAILSEPDPGWENVPPAPIDEVHHRLSNGMPIHVGVFVGPGLQEQQEAVPSLDFNAGWLQILTGPVDVLGR